MGATAKVSPKYGDRTGRGTSLARRVGVNAFVLLGMVLSFKIPVTLAGPPQSATASSAAPSKPWQVFYSMTGGVAGLHECIRISDDGQASLACGGEREPQPTGLLTPEERRRLQDVVERVDLSRASSSAPQGPNYPDAIHVQVSITSGGRTLYLANRELFSTLSSLQRELTKRFKDEAWRAAGPFQLGRAWHVSEEVRDKEMMYRGNRPGTWTRIGKENRFEAVWPAAAGRAEEHDTLEVDKAERGEVLLHGRSSGRRYSGRYSPSRQDHVAGTITGTAQSWQATVEY